MSSENNTYMPGISIDNANVSSEHQPLRDHFTFGMSRSQLAEYFERVKKRAIKAITEDCCNFDEF